MKEFPLWILMLQSTSFKNISGPWILLSFHFFMREMGLQMLLFRFSVGLKSAQGGKCLNTLTLQRNANMNIQLLAYTLLHKICLERKEELTKKGKKGGRAFP